MSATAILDAAYKSGIVPPHLYGKTQQKTLQARLSEEILQYKRTCQFFRTEPGVFFLTELISDPTVPEEYKTVFPARRRTRDLFQSPALAISKDYLESKMPNTSWNWTKIVEDATENNAIKYVNPNSSHEGYALVWSFSLVRRDQYTLAYRIGRYRDDRDMYANRKTIGFPGLLNVDNRTLFSMNDFGAAECSMDAIFTDLDISISSFNHTEDIDQPKITNILIVDDTPKKSIVLLIMQWECPDWLEPTSRRLSLNNLGWMDLSCRPNDIDDFEPWSRATLEAMQTT